MSDGRIDPIEELKTKAKKRHLKNGWGEDILPAEPEPILEHKLAEIAAERMRVILAKSSLKASSVLQLIAAMGTAAAHEVASTTTGENKLASVERMLYGLVKLAEEIKEESEKDYSLSVNEEEFKTRATIKYLLQALFLVAQDVGKPWLSRALGEDRESIFIQALGPWNSSPKSSEEYLLSPKAAQRGKTIQEALKLLATIFPPEQGFFRLKKTKFSTLEILVCSPEAELATKTILTPTHFQNLTETDKFRAILQGIKIPCKTNFFKPAILSYIQWISRFNFHWKFPESLKPERDLVLCEPRINIGVATQALSSVSGIEHNLKVLDLQWFDISRKLGTHHIEDVVEFKGN